MRRIFVIVLFLVGAVLAVARGEEVTYAEQWEKVLAPKGVFADELLWHDYGAFGLYWVSAETLATTHATLQTSAQLDMLNLTAQTFNTQRDSTNFATRSAATTETGHKLSLVQFVGPIKQAWLDALVEGGIRPIHYVSQNAYLVWTDDAGRATLQTATRRAETIQYVIDYLPSFKLDSTLRQQSGTRTAVPVTVQMIQHPRQAETEQLIAQLAGEKLNWEPVLQFQNTNLTLSSVEIEQLLQQPDVFWIGERLPRILYDEIQAQIMAGNLDGSADTGYLAWLDSLGFSQNPADYPIVDIVDDGIGNGNATDGAGDTTLTVLGDGTTSRLAYVANCTSADSGESIGGHGHINVSIAGGYDQRSGFPFHDSLGYQRGQGINPYGHFAGTRIFDPNFNLIKCNDSITSLIKLQQDNGALVSSNSWGANNNGEYDSTAQLFDVGVRDADLSETGNQEMIMIVAAGNKGENGAATVGSPATAKNVIAVGASENIRPTDEDGAWTDGCGTDSTGADNAMDVSGFSSRGPVEGNRTKPDVIAPGTHIQGTASTSDDYSGSGVCDTYRPSAQTTFAASSGTSHAAPAVAGTTSLYYHWLEKQYGLLPSPAMMKAYLIAHPTYLTGVSADDTLPSNAQGYGMPNMMTAFDDTTRQLVDQTTIFDAAGETWIFSGDVADSTKPLRIVLAWTDAPGVLGGDPSVNDLDLSISVEGASYLGNVFNGQWSVTGGGSDKVNNVEAIYLPAGVTGQIVVTVTAANIAGDGVPNSGDTTDQDFALVCYNCAETPDFTLSATPTSITSCIPNDAIYTLSVGAIENFADPVTLAAQLPANASGNFATNPVSPIGTSQLTIDTQSMSAGDYTIPVVGTASSGQHTTTLQLALDESVVAATTLQAPVNNAIDQSLLPTLSWTNTGADSYVLELATDAAFTAIVESATLLATNYAVPTQLEPNTRYYWRVRGINGCGASADSADYTFRTADIACNLYTSSNVPIGIPTDVATIRSTLTIPNAGHILDVNVRELAGTHSRMGNLAFALASPTGTQIDLFANVCAGNDDFALGFDDEAASSTLPCPPTDGNVYRPAMPLSTFDGEPLTGEWSLIITDSVSFDGGSLNSWGLEICSTVPAPPSDFSLVIEPASTDICLPNSSSHTITLQKISGFDETVTLGATGLPGGLSADFAQNTIDNTTTLDVTAAANASAGSHLLNITGSTTTKTNTTVLPLTLAATPPNSPVLTLPVMDAEDVATTPTFTWDDSAGATAYLFELAADSTFANPITSTTVTDNQLTLSDELAHNTRYYWRVTPTNVCGAAEPAVGNFVTLAGSLSCGETVPFETGIPTDWVVGGVGGINWVGSNAAECNNLGNQTGGAGLAACVNRDQQGSGSYVYDSILETNQFDLSTTESATVTVKTYFHDYRFNSNDGFAIERYDGAQWVALLNSAGTSIDGETLSFHLPNNTTQLRFRHYGNSWDYYAQIDDVALRCVEGSPTAVGMNGVASAEATRTTTILILTTMLLVGSCLTLRFQQNR